MPPRQRRGSKRLRGHRAAKPKAPPRPARAATAAAAAEPTAQPSAVRAPAAARKPRGGLKVVTAETEPPKPPAKPPSVLEAADSGDFFTELQALHRRIATAVSDPFTPARDLAALTRRQLEISREIRAIRAADEGDEVGNAADTPDEQWVAT